MLGATEMPDISISWQCQSHVAALESQVSHEEKLLHWESNAALEQVTQSMYSLYLDVLWIELGKATADLI